MPIPSATLRTAWLEEGELLREAHRPAGVCGVLIHGWLGLSCSLDTAWDLAQALPGAELFAPNDSGHLGSMSNANASCMSTEAS